jgi:hypothetical protein
VTLTKIKKKNLFCNCPLVYVKRNIVKLTVIRCEYYGSYFVVPFCLLLLFCFKPLFYCCYFALQLCFPVVVLFYNFVFLLLFYFTLLFYCCYFALQLCFPVVVLFYNFVLMLLFCFTPLFYCCDFVLHLYFTVATLLYTFVLLL